MQPLLCWRKGVFHISTDRQLLDIEAIQRFQPAGWAAAERLVPRPVLWLSLQAPPARLRPHGDRLRHLRLGERTVRQRRIPRRGLGSWLTRCRLAHPALRGLRVTLPALQAPWRADGSAHTPCAPFTDEETPMSRLVLISNKQCDGAIWPAPARRWRPMPNRGCGSAGTADVQNFARSARSAAGSAPVTDQCGPFRCRSRSFAATIRLGHHDGLWPKFHNQPEKAHLTPGKLPAIGS
ncbi:hypothetical protein M8494_25130 [Serratia ureilytica]